MPDSHSKNMCKDFLEMAAKRPMLKSRGHRNEKLRVSKTLQINSRKFCPKRLSHVTAPSKRRNIFGGHRNLLKMGLIYAKFSLASPAESLMADQIAIYGHKSIDEAVVPFKKKEKKTTLQSVQETKSNKSVAGREHLYGPDEATQLSFVNGKKVADDGLPPVGQHGIDITGFKENWRLGLSPMHDT
ncbi:hypothetical protein C8F01DRAFT_1096711 [Mycena amicta]|nr:hypothetical protein C8F01DRAFT_1096711 [Mycena amicta]